jgi:hypothetical protein
MLALQFNSLLFVFVYFWMLLDLRLRFLPLSVASCSVSTLTNFVAIDGVIKNQLDTQQDATLKGKIPYVKLAFYLWVLHPVAQNLEDHSDHHEEIQMFTALDILTFCIWDRLFTENFDDFTICYIYIQFDVMYRDCK